MEKCGVCGNDLQEIEIGAANVGGHKCATADESLRQDRLPLVLRFCTGCTLVQYKQVPEADAVLDKIYSEQHATYSQSSEISQYVSQFAAELARDTEIVEGAILEIGCNDGMLLREFKDTYGRKVIGVEPGHSFHKSWAENDIVVINEYFDEEVSERLSGEKFSLIIVRHVLEHIPNPDAFIHSVSKLMDEKTVLVIESPYLPTVLSDGRYENINYSHLNHFTMKAISILGAKYGLEVVSFKEVSTDGGSFVAKLQKGDVPDKAVDTDNIVFEDLQLFVSRMRENGSRLRAAMERYAPGELAGYGAGAKGPHLLSLYGLSDLLAFVVDDNVAAHGTYLAGSTVKVVGPDYLSSAELKAIVNLAPTHRDVVREKVPSHLELIDVI